MQSKGLRISHDAFIWAIAYHALGRPKISAIAKNKQADPK
jgi:hypothetical protein